MRGFKFDPYGPYQHPFLNNRRFSRGHKGPITSGYLRGEHQTNDFAVRLSQCSRNSLRVDIHGRSSVRMSQEFLLHLEIDPQGMK